MRNRWSEIDRHTRCIILLAVGFIIFRIVVASLSGFGFHQGWNEGHYALIANGFLEHPLVPRYGDNFVYNVPPLFPYTVAASFILFGKSVIAARLPSILATGGLIIATYTLGHKVFEDRTTAVIGSSILTPLPYVQLFGGRAQTDVMMVFFVTASLSVIVRGYRRQTDSRRWLIIGGALFAAAVATKQPAFGVAPIVLFWLVGNRAFDLETVRRTGVLIGASALFLLPIIGWFYVNYMIAPSAFVADWRHELLKRTDLFANVRLLVAIAFGLGITPPVLVGTAIGVGTDIRDTLHQYRERMTKRPGPSILTWWLVVYGAFVFARTPHGHQYYAVILTPPIALFTAQGIRTIVDRLQGVNSYSRTYICLVLLTIVLMSTIAGTVVLFELSGEFSVANGGGTQVAVDASDFIVGEVPENATILVPNGYVTPIKWYVREDMSVEHIESYRVSSPDERRLQTIIKGSKGPVYIIYPSPSWGNPPSIAMDRVYTTSAYNYTIMSYIGRYVETSSKFTFYLTDRRIEIYRVEES